MSARRDGVNFEALPAQPRTTARLVRIFLGAYPRRTAWLCLGLLVAGLLEGVGVSMFLPLLDLILNSGSATDSPLAALVSRSFGAIGLTPTLPSLLGARVYIGLSEQAFRRVVLSLLTASGFVMLASSLPKLLA